MSLLPPARVLILFYLLLFGEAVSHRDMQIDTTYHSNLFESGCKEDFHT
jgi:hypothetical protein